MTGRRADVLAALRATGRPLSVVETAALVAIHPNTARFHLEALIKTGQVELAEVKPAKAGRPPSMFQAVPGMDPAGRRDYRTLAGVLADAVGRHPNAAALAGAAGRAWAAQLGDRASARSRKQAVNRLTGLLTELGFAPQNRANAAGVGEIALRHCPFLELARTHRDVVCPVHLGLMQGLMTLWKAPITVDALDPFVEPDLCVAHLSPVGQAS